MANVTSSVRGTVVCSVKGQCTDCIERNSSQTILTASAANGVNTTRRSRTEKTHWVRSKRSLLQSHEATHVIGICIFAEGKSRGASHSADGAIRSHVTRVRVAMLPQSWLGSVQDPRGPHHETFKFELCRPSIYTDSVRRYHTLALYAPKLLLPSFLARQYFLPSSTQNTLLAIATRRSRSRPDKPSV